MTTNKWIFITASTTAILISCVLIRLFTSYVEKPAYSLIKSFDIIELRKYEPMIISKVKVSGNRSEAIAKGFKVLAKYISGYNLIQKKIDMTAPVQQQYKEGSWEVSFIMPRVYLTASLIPKPKNSDILIETVPPKYYYVIRFSGSHSTENIESNKKRLVQYIYSNQLKTRGSPKYSFYNPPWTLPFMRRNEIMIEIDN